MDNNQSQNQGTILIVDDDLEHLEFFSAILSTRGYGVRGIISSSTVLQVARLAPPDLILLDIKMVEMDGYEVCQQLKADEITNQIPIIFISASHNILDKVKAFKTGGVDYITKPFQMEEVFVRIENQITIRRLQRKLQEQNNQLQVDVTRRELAEKVRDSRECYLAALVEVQRSLLNYDGCFECYENLLKILGTVTKACRTYIFEHNSNASGLLMSLKTQWCSNVNNSAWQNLKNEEFLPRWVQLLSRGEIIKSVVAELNESERSILQSQGILAILIIPIISKGQLLGFIGFDNCVNESVWEQWEVDMLQSAVAAISLANERKFAEEALQQELNRSIVLRKITDKIRSELDTKKVLETAACEIGKALNVSRVLIHTYLDGSKPQIPLQVEFLASGYTSLMDVDIPVTDNPHILQLLLTDKAIASDNVLTEPLLQNALDICQHFEIKSLLAVRTSYQGEANGIIGLHQCNQLRNWKATEIELFESIAAQLGIALAQAKLLEQEKQAKIAQQQQNLQLQEQIIERVNAEAALVESESKYRCLVETSQDVIFSLGITGIVTFVNIAVQQIFGYEPEEMIDRHFTEFIFPAEVASVTELFQRVVQGARIFQQEIICQRKDGEVIYMMLNAIAVQDNFGLVVGVTGTVNSITERKLAEAARRASEAKLMSAFRSSPDPIFLATFPEISFIEVNDSFCKCFGYDRNQVIGSSNLDLNIWVQPEESNMLIEILLHTKAVRNHEIDFRIKSGEIKTTIFSAELIEIDGISYVLGTAKDITERKQAENESRLLLLTAQAITRAVNVDAALALVLRLICSTISWDFSEAWIPTNDGTVLEYSLNWHENNEDLEEFCAYSRTMVFSRGFGLPGRIWQTRQAEWIEDVTIVKGSTFVRSQAAKQAGLKACFGVPILVGERVLAVLIFFRHIYTPIDKRLLYLVNAVAAQLGALIQRKQVEAAHRQSEERLQLALEASDLGLWDWNLNTNQVYFDWRWKKMLGYEQQEIGNIFPPFPELVHPEDLATVTSALQTHLEGRSPVYEVEFRMRCQNHEWKWIQCRGQIFERDESGIPLRMTGTHKDITERKNLETELVLRQARLNAFFSAAPVGLCILDDQLRFIKINQLLAEINGYSVSEHIGKTIFEILPHNASFIEPLYQQVLSTGEVILNSELTSRSCEQPDYERHFLASHFPIFGGDDKPSGIGSVLMEITELQTALRDRQLAERELRLATERLQYLLTSSPAVIYSCKASGDYSNTFISDNVSAMLGYSAQEFMEDSNFWFRNLHPEDVERILQELSELKHKEYVNFEYRFLHADNSYHWFYEQVRLIRDSLGNPIEYLGYWTDISDRKLAEIALQKSQLRYQTLAEASPVCIFHTDIYGNILYLNRRWSDLTGLPVEESLGMGWAKAIHPDDKERVLTEWNQAITTQIPYHIEHRLLHTNGRTLWVIAQALPEMGDNSEIKGYVGTVTNISDRKFTELALLESQKRYQTLAEASPVCIHHTDRFGNWLYVNQCWTEITGLSPEESLGTGWIKALHPSDRDRVCKEWYETVAARKSYQSEYRVLHTNERVVWVIAQALPEFSENGELKGYIATVTNITENKLAEAALMESAERERAIAKVIQKMRQTLDLETIFSATTQELRHVLNCDRVVVYRFNSDWSGEFVAESQAGGWISLIQQHDDCNFSESALQDDRCAVQKINSKDNQVLDTYLQETEGGVYGRGASFLCVPDIHTAGFETCYVNLLEKFQARAYITVPIFCGNQLWGLLASYQNSTPRQWKTGEINIVVQIGNQLGVALQQAELYAETQRQSQALKEAAIAADAANRAKSEFLANMSHELRTPLNAILGFTQVMSRDLTVAEEHLQNLVIINRAGEHLLNLINDILEMSKIEAGRTTLNLSSFDLVRLLKNLEEMLRLRATSKGLNLIFEIALDIPQYIQTDANKLRQVLLNLLGNAIKFTETGSVTLRVGVKSRKREIVSKLFFEVIDTGSGISQQEMHLLFEAFGQTETGRKSQQGSGLGLAISQKYIQLMGGDISVSSTVDVGSTFTFDLEINIANPNDIQLTSKYQVIGLAPNQAQYRILIVEDRPDSRLLLVTLLTSMGFVVKEATNGVEAVSLWSSWQPHLILMDMRMPVMDGYEATRQIKALQQEQADDYNFLDKQTVIIALTASAFEQERQAMMKAGCDDLINKPFREELLLEKIAKHLNVEYVYQEENQEIEKIKHRNQQNFVPTNLEHLLSQMSPEWLTQLHNAAAQCSDDLILQLIEQIPSGNQPLARFIQNLASNFQFERIMDISMR
jgi:PAS domain S-box-containing protein